MVLKGKTVLVTGGSKGIGRATVIEMAKQGANVIINYSHDRQSVDETLESIKQFNIKTHVAQADVSSREEVDKMFEQIKKEFSSVDVLVNSAGIFVKGDSPDNIEAFEKLFRVNYLGQIYVTNCARKLMSKGKIIFLSSIHGKIGHGRPDAIAYSSMKAALDSYMKNLAKYLAPDILVNAIAPGRVLTPLWGTMDETYKKKQAEGHLIERWIDPSEIADAVVFLAKNDAVCGEVLVIDGGMSLKVLG